MAWDIAEELIERLGDKLEVGGANIPDVDNGDVALNDLAEQLANGEGGAN